MLDLVARMMNIFGLPLALEVRVRLFRSSVVMVVHIAMHILTVGLPKHFSVVTVTLRQSQESD